MRKSQKNLLKILPRLQAMIEQDGYFADLLVEDLDPWLDELSSYDFFGTERQCDPRGDFRDGDWSLFDKVQ